MSDNNLASELVEKGTFFKPITSEEIVIFMINYVTIATVDVFPCEDIMFSRESSRPGILYDNMTK